MSGMAEPSSRIGAFLAAHIRGQNIGVDDDIFALGFVSSLFALELVMFLEREFEIHIDNEDLDLANFRTIRAMSALVANKTAA